MLTITDGTAQFVVKKLDTITVNMFNQFKEFVNNEFKKQLNSNYLYNLLHRYGDNKDLKGLSNTQWNQMGIFIMYFVSNNKIENQPSQWGQLINLPTSVGFEDSMQIWIEQASGATYIRGGNAHNEIRNRKFTYIGGRQ